VEAFVSEDHPEIRFELRSVKEGPRTDEDSAPRLEDDGLPEISFDLSFLDHREAADIEPAEEGQLQMRFDRQQQESDLLEGFRQRTADLQRLAAEREDPRPSRLERPKSRQAG
jgi:hypothetical protein